MFLDGALFEKRKQHSPRHRLRFVTGVAYQLAASSRSAFARRGAAGFRVGLPVTAIALVVGSLWLWVLAR